jgi:hypothetical protein
MNFTPNFFRSATFVKFKRGVGKPDALEYLFNLTQTCQLGRTTKLPLADDLELQLSMELPVDLDINQTRDLLVSCGIISQSTDCELYNVDLFEKMNGQLIACWENGTKGGRPKEKTSPASVGRRGNMEIGDPF